TDSETLHGLRRLVIAEVVGAEAGSAAVRDLLDAPIVRYPHRPFVERAWALRGQLTACDGLYVALAEALGATLVTTDRELARAVTTVDVVAPA
ncbi:MAG: type II toxin-antitoxin system VapC family toxin, partial [Thermoleophilia bacterium]|nr:type II toxin-antitoxin system VapC family toxin [Thermoleophilia bacterium]